ncbi:MAG: helix-turn-helix domain-containing protein [Ignavibacteriaceae bacterium]
MNLDKYEIAARLRTFGESKFERIKDFAKALDMEPSSLQSAYLNGRSIPGPELLVKLSDMGCDIIWLLTGEITTHSPPSIDISDKIKELEEENRLLRDNIDRIQQLTQAINTRKDMLKKPRRR